MDNGQLMKDVDNKSHADMIAMLIMSCDKFSDLWEGNIKLLEEYWPDREMKTYIVTDKASDKNFDGITVLAAGDNVEWTDRLRYALKQIDARYIFITLDDYFLIRPVQNEEIRKLINMMEAEGVDYTRLFPRPKRATCEQMPQYRYIHRIDTKINYSVNLYAGIWKKSFLLKAAEKSSNVWKFEVSLSKVACESAARCVVDKQDVFHILDVVRKGKLLHKSARYFRSHPGLYNGTREVNTWGYEIKLGIRTFGARHAPKCVINAVRAYMISKGHHYFSQDAD